MSKIAIYGFSGTIYMLLCLIRTRLFYPKSRMIKYPFDVRGKKHIDFGENLTIGKNCRFEVYPHLMEGTGITLRIGKNVVLNDYIHITALKAVTIGDNVLMASHIYISDCQHGFYHGEKQSSPEENPMYRKYYISPVSIKENAWIGEHVSILPGITIGKGSIIGANSVVTHDIPDYSIAVGIPAKVIKKYDFELKKWDKV